MEKFMTRTVKPIQMSSGVIVLSITATHDGTAPL